MDNVSKNSRPILQGLIVGLLGASVLWNNAIADGEAEREALACLIHELEAVEPLIHSGSRASSPRDPRTH